MHPVIAVVARSGAALLPLTLLTLSWVFVASVAVLRPTTERQAMVDRLAEATKNLAEAIVGRGGKR